VYKKLEHFGVRLLVCDPYLSPERQQLIRAPFVDLRTVLAESDYVTLHTPLNDETRHLINVESLSWMKPSSYLINTSRGGMVDHDALAAALRNGQIAGAAIDVYDTEPPHASFPLFELDNVILTPHESWYSVDAERTIREKIVLTIDMFLNGTGPRYPVNPEVLSSRGANK
jgi:D-3-phosphoglycerate dehydrogenase